MVLVNFHVNDTEESLSLICQTNQTIKSIKKQIIDKQAIELNKILIYYKNNIRDDKSTLQGISIQNNSILEAWIDEEELINIRIKFIWKQRWIIFSTKLESNIKFNLFFVGITDQLFNAKLKDEILRFIVISYENVNLQFTDQRSLSMIGFKNGCLLTLSFQDKFGCYPFHTQVIMSDGYKKFIGDVQIGDKVLSYDYKSQKYIKSRVVETHIGLISQIFLISTVKQSITTTSNNSFLTEGGWKSTLCFPRYDIQMLSTKDKILNVETKFIEITSIQQNDLQEFQSVYNITTEYPFNFFANDLLVCHYSNELIEIIINEKIQELKIDVNMMIHNIKGMISMKYGIKIEHQELYYDGKMLSDEELINKYMSDFKMLTLSLQILKELVRVNQNNPEIISLKLVSNMYAVQFNLAKNTSFQQLSRIIHKYLDENHAESSQLLYNNQFYDLANKDIDINVLNLKNHTYLLFITERSISAYQLTYFLQNIKSQDIRDLKASLSFLEQKKGFTAFFEEQQKMIDQNQSNQFFKQFETHHLMAIKLWTSSYVYKQLNTDLRNNKFDKWSGYLKCLMQALRSCNFYKGITYRGIPDYQNTEYYSIGKKIQWSEISSSSKNKKVALCFSNDKGMLFELNSISGRDIEHLSNNEDEEEVLMPPFSQYVVESVEKQENQSIYVKLRELPQPRSSQILLWIDDNPENNYQHVQELEKENSNISVVFCTSTKDAIDLIQTSRFMIYLDDQNVRIVTDMVRFEEGVWNYDPGIQFLKYLIDNFNYDYQVLIFCGDVQRAQDNCNQLNIIGNYIISNQEEVLKKFIRFQ